MDDVMNSVAVPDNSFFITTLTQTTNRLDVWFSGILPECCLVKPRKFPRQANHPFYKNKGQPSADCPLRLFYVRIITYFLFKFPINLSFYRPPCQTCGFSPSVCTNDRSTPHSRCNVRLFHNGILCHRTLLCGCYVGNYNKLFRFQHSFAHHPCPAVRTIVIVATRKFITYRALPTVFATNVEPLAPYNRLNIFQWMNQFFIFANRYLATI